MRLPRWLTPWRRVGALALVGALIVGIWAGDEYLDDEDPLTAPTTTPGHEIAPASPSSTDHSSPTEDVASAAPPAGTERSQSSGPSAGSRPATSPDRSATSGSLLWLVGPATQGGDADVDRLVVADGDGSNARTIADGGVSNAVWSPSGTQIAFLRPDAASESEPVQSYGLFVINADGSGIRRVSTTAVDQRASMPSSLAWSPDGSRIAHVQGFTAIGGCQSDLWIVHLATGNRQQLTEGSCDYSPTWSPDAERIAFFRWAGGTRLWSIKVDGTGATPLSPVGQSPREGSGKWPPMASWSPDGSLVAYDFGPDVYVIGADGSDSHALTTPEPGRSHSSPVWSPDGSRLALLEWSESAHSVVVVDRSGTVRARLAGDQAREHTLSWSPDGRNLVAERQTSYGIIEMHVIPIDGSPSVPLGAPGRAPLFAPV